MSIQSKLKSSIPDVVGNLNLQYLNNTVLLSGQVYTQEPEKLQSEIKDYIAKTYPDAMVSSSLKVNEFVAIEENLATTNKQHEEVLDEINILYYGKLPIKLIQPNSEFKTVKLENKIKVDNSVKVLNFLAPIILDRNMKIIDGNLRYELAIENGIKSVLVVILDDSGIKSDFLRLALNRSSEFQRWDYRDVDAYVDSVPQAQPILEPLGFFGKTILPTSYFSNTVLGYVIDPFNDKQKAYKQEEGLAEWAKYRREQMQKESDQKRAKRVKMPTDISLFSLIPKEEDFLPTYNAEEEMEKMTTKWREKAESITQAFDEKRKAELEEQGREWQGSHRTSKKKAEDNRKEAIKSIKNSKSYTDEEKLIILANLDEFAEILKSPEEVKEHLEKYLSGE